MTREQMIETAKAMARAMGWESIAEDAGGIVTMLLSSEGASDQMVMGPLSRLRRELSFLGGPENYPALEEYDLPEPALVEQDGSWTEEAEQLAPSKKGELPAGPDGEDEPDSGPSPEEAKEAEMYGYSMKDVHRSLTGQVSDQDRGGIPRPEQKESEMKKATASSSVFHVQGLNTKARTLEGAAFSSGVYHSSEKAMRGARGAVAAGLKEVRVVRLLA